MTRRIAVVGTSNIGALKYAAGSIALDHPGLSVTFWGLPGGKFAECATDPGGVFQPLPGDTETRKLAQRINGADHLDLTRFDATLVIADTMGLPSVLFVAGNYDVIDWPPRRGKPLLSEPGFRAAMDEAIAARADDLARQFRGVAPLYLARAPYPTTVVTRRGKLRLEPFASVAGHPEAARIELLYTEALSRALAERKMAFVAQPQDTIAAPFLTRPEFGKDAMDFRAAGRVLDDHRHMNAAFGASLFRAFALALGPDMTGAAPTPARQE
ncbi:hypothetical protein [Roseicyclus mahoneyensis]|uniref:GDSL-like lipase/acylhydrolase family protein n=1 Tax=Roseicyclus mahoneyensis TaxID=164332 RepID=A0A316GEQ3_9RHOB|nr:hypothetical protein [Roseicyclus mahoneyensis]PWK59424.1 hypothetical protein C7455_108192 [Roseicyclus mahoneyensis]